MVLSYDQSSLSWSLIALIAFALLLVVNSYIRLTEQLIPTLSVDLSEGDQHASTLAVCCKAFCTISALLLQPKRKI